MSDLAQLSHLALVNRVLSELVSQLSLDDRDLAEFLIDLASQSRDESDFRHRMADSGGDFDSRFIGRLWDVLAKGLTQSRALQAEEAKTRTPASWDAPPSKDDVASKYRALALADTAPVPLNPEPTSPSSSFAPSVDASRKRRRSPSPPRARQSRWDAEGAPVLYGVYPAVISNVKDTLGAFADLQGSPQGRCEGLVHISQLTGQGRVQKAGDVVKRGQRVWVKVINRVGKKIGLSMREVDQTSGEDLRPRSPPHPSLQPGPSPPQGNEDLFANPARPLSLDGLGGGRDAPPTAGRAVEAAPMHRPPARLSSPERWVEAQLRASGVVRGSDGPASLLSAQAAGGGAYPLSDDEEEVDIELNESEPGVPTRADGAGRRPVPYQGGAEP